MSECTGVVILNYNNYEETINCIDSIEKYNSASIKYYIIENGSSRKESVPSLIKYCTERFKDDCQVFDYENESVSSYHGKRLTFVVSKLNNGYAAGNNKGLALANIDEEVENILVINNDVLFVEDIIPSLINNYKNLDNPGIISPILYKKEMSGYDYNCARNNPSIWYSIVHNLFYYPRKIVSKLGIIKGDSKHLLYKYEGKALPKYMQIELPSGSCMFVDKKYFESIGFFDDKTFLYWEENILHRKIESTGRVNYLCTELNCIHLGASSTSVLPWGKLGKHGLNSSMYYYKNYTNSSSFELSVYQFSYKFYSACFGLVKRLQGKI